jgi:tetratricopeptide (TPR) repeat protein
VRTHVKALILLLLCSLGAQADVIRLKNGRAISADRVRDLGNRIEYELGEDTYAIPKSLVERIDSGFIATPTSSSAPPSTSSSHSSEAMSAEESAALLVDLESAELNLMRARIVHDGRVDRDAVQAIESSGNQHLTAVAYFAAGVQSHLSGDRDGAERYLRNALAIEPNSPQLLANYAGALMVEQRYSDALPYAEQAARLSPQRGDVLALLGSAYFYSDRTVEAISVWKKSLTMRPSPMVRALLAKAEREQAVQESFHEESTGHFTLHYEGRESSPQLRRQLLTALEGDFDDLVRDFGVSPRDSIPVVIYTNQAFVDVTQAPAWAEAMNDGKLRIPVEGLNGVSADMAKVLKHELAHSFIREVTHGRCPQWLNEGVAQAVEPRSTAPMGRSLAMLFSAHREIPLQLLEGGFTSFSGGAATVAYAESLAAVEHIRDTYGFTDVVQILQRIGQGLTTEQALRATIHSSYSDLEQELAVGLNRRYGN